MQINESGLTEQQAVDSRQKYGSNMISHKKRNKFLELFLENLGDPIIRILLIALGMKIVFIMSSFDWYETIGIAIAILLASLISTLSEYGSEVAFKKMQEEASQTYSKVYRDGKLKQISIGDVVCRDVILLQAGDKIPADGILINGSISVDESALTGESKEINKDKDNNKLLRGSIVCAGECKMLAMAVGDKTHYGNIALELQDEQRDSPLKIRLRVLAKIISRFGYIGAILVSVAYLFNRILIQNNFDLGKISTIMRDWHAILGHLLEAVTLAVTVIVVAVPEGLPMMITLVLSLNMKKMLKDNVLVRKLLGIETSVNLNILFTDKTGTITSGKLKVQMFIDGSGKQYSELNDIIKNKGLYEMLEISLLYNNAASMEGKHAIGSNVTDRALLEYISSTNNKWGVKKNNIVAFDSKIKMSITKITGSKNMHLIKGAPERILPNCSSFYNEKGSKTIIYNKTSLKNKLTILSSGGIRFIAVATSDKEIDKDIKLSDLTLVGLIGIKDEIRREVPEALELVEKAGVQVVMMTGDSSDTAQAIAKEIKLLKNESVSLSSDELNKYSDEELKKILPKVRLISRALPQDKSRLVKISQEMGLVVGMTGDGVNDAPALKKADVGFAMGSGTEVAKEASDIVLIDDNFLSIAKAILYGRTIFKSIRKFIIFQLTVNLCAVGLSIIGPFIGINTPITVIQMLWINMIMDTLAALAFAGEPPLKEYMDEKPKEQHESIVNHYMMSQILITGIYSLILCILFLKLPFIEDIFDSHDDTHLMTGFFALFIFMSIYNSFNTRTHRLNLLAHILKNKGFMAVMLFITIVQVYLIYYGGELFRVTGLSLYEFWIVNVLAFTVIPVDWIRKVRLRFKGEVGGV